MVFKVRFPASGSERLRVGLRGSEPPLRALVAVRVPASEGLELSHVRQAIRDLGYAKRTGSRFSYSYREVTDKEKRDPDLPELILEWVRGQADEIAKAGLPQAWQQEDALGDA